MPFACKSSIAILALIALANTIPAAELTDDAVTGATFFENEIRPLLAQHCYQCHSERAKKQEGELLLDRRDGWIKGGTQGPAIVAGDVDASLLIRAVRYGDTNLQMPPIKPLPADVVAKLEQWVRIGAPGPLNNEVVKSDAPSDPIAGKSHWAFQPLKLIALPAVKASEWPQSAIDRFVLARLEQEQLSPVKDAAPRDLIRRVSFQLTGLPPATDEVEGFVADERPDALERVVDRLIASPHFGERWGRHWLDLARYADSNGLDENFLFREAWRYRNWVIEAVNDSMPLDRFVLEQMAGDLLPFESIAQRDRQRIAAGFLVIGPKVLLGNNPKNQRMEVADELIDTMGRAILGQTLGCARCHDHKFDPIPTADYYSLAGIFASTMVMEQRYMLGEQRVMERLVGLGLGGADVDEAYEMFWREQPKLNAKKKTAEAGLEALNKANDQTLIDVLKKHDEQLVDGAKGVCKSLEDRIAAQVARIAEITAMLSNAPKIPPRAMIPADVDPPADEQIRIAGQFDRPGEQVPRGFLQVLCDTERVAIPAQQSGRLALARWLFDSHSRSGHLAARVLSNRVWHHLLGRGVVRTVDNFGRTGEPPSHPELLDLLARDLIDSQWSLKTLVRHVAQSRTFALSCEYDLHNDQVDPENRLLWRAHRRRLDPESLRDAMLAVAGRMDSTPMDSTVSYLHDQATAVGPNTVRRRTDFPCRSVYLPVIRNDLPELFEVFDFANPHAATGARPKTTAPSQGLFMLNAELVLEMSDATARRILIEAPSNDADSRIDLMFQFIIGGTAQDELRAPLRAFMIQSEGRLKAAKDDQAELKALALACHALFASTRFQFLE